jgi:large repetitive protein
MKKITTFTFCLFVMITTLFGQGRLNYENDSRWFWGLNLGSTWQSTDIRNKNDFGWGLTIGKAYNYDYGKRVSFDIRGRYLYGTWFGQNVVFTDTTQGLPMVLNNPDQNSIDYASQYGGSVLNFQTKAHRFALELVLHANGVRERTGWDPYIFGGAGFTFFQTTGDYLDNFGNAYDFQSLNTLNPSTLETFQDGAYETYLDGSTNGTFNVGFMPSLGIGLGYQVAPRFSLGIEHKSTFTRLDYFDGYNANAGIRQNDIYHYTSFYLKFHVKARNKKPVNTTTTTTTTNTNTVDRIPNYDGQNNQPPVVTFTNPSVSGQTVMNPSYIISADVRFVENRNNVMFRQNGNYNGNFSFNPSTNRFECPVTLVPGQNVFELSGTNVYGTDSKTTVVIYQRETPTPPVVIITNPANSPQQVSSPTFNFQGNVLNIQNKNQATLTLNGQNIPNFNFTTSNGNVLATLNLVVGTNIVTLTGTNNAGSDSKSVTIIYSPMQTEQPPIVYFVDPHFSPFTTTNSTFLINAEVVNVAGRQNIIFKQNGSVNQNFTYDAISDDFQSSVVLNPGQNVFEIIATNSAGSAQATTIIIFERQAPKPPIVTITNPPTTPFTTESPVFALNATVLNVTMASQIKVSLNGQSLTNFNYIQANNTVTAMLNLVEGSNTLIVRATNNDGTDMKQTVIIYRKPVVIPPPVVNFLAPSVDPFITNSPTYNVVASVLNVANQSGVNVNVNGNNFTGFTFNQNQVSFPITLIEGTNVIVVTGTNQSGTDSKSQTIIYRKPQTVLPPVVTFINPVSSPLTVFNQNYNLRARVENVSGAQNIQLKINGVPTTNFTFTSSSQFMDFSSSLNPGANIFEITATNSAGSDMATTTIVFRQTAPSQPPVVTITRPLQNPHTVSSSTTPITASVLNVDGQQNIQVTLNGNAVTNFTYNTSTKLVNFTASLNEGVNNLVITASNTSGQASDSRVINFRKEVVVLPPFVTFLNPSEPGKLTNNPSTTMRAKVTNVSDANQITVSMNGMMVSSHLWNFNPANNEVSMNTGLNIGNNGFIITATNSAGSHTASMNVIYRPAMQECVKPVITFITPLNATTNVDNARLQFNARVSNVTAAQNVKIFLNGIQIDYFTFNVTTGAISQLIMLSQGQNIIEVVAENNCGEVKGNRIVIFKQVESPCLAPSIQALEPTRMNSNVQSQNITIKASTLNVSNASELKLLVNGLSKAFNYDAASRNIVATVDLNVGNNTIKLEATTSCGTANVSWTVNRTDCTKPTVTVTGSSVAHKGTTFSQAFTLTAAISGVDSRNQISVTQNGKAINFVYDANTRVLSVDRPLDMGKNNFIITATNSCGNDSKTHEVTRRNDPSAVPPTINITNPSTTPFTTTDGAINVVISTKNVTAANQVSVTVNGAQTNFNFNPSNGEITFNRTLNPGNNTIVATAVTQHGTTSDTKVVIYNRQTVQKPEIVIQSPATCPATLPVGTTTVRGYITNITDLNQVSFMMNGRPISNFNPVFANGRMAFSFTMSVNSNSNAFNIVITATNQGGSDTKECVLTPVEERNPSGGGSTNPGGDGRTNTNKKPADNKGGTTIKPTENKGGTEKTPSDTKGGTKATPTGNPGKGNGGTQIKTPTTGGGRGGN